MTKLGKLVFTLVILGIAAFAVINWWPKVKPGTSTVAQATTDSAATPRENSVAVAPAESVDFLNVPDQVPQLPAPQPYQVKDNTILIELSEYAGYAGLFVANGGLAPSEDSFFFKNYGFKVEFKLSEEDSWAALNRGEMAGSSTTVDVLAAYGRQMNVTVPAQICYSRGADGIVVRSEIRRINDLKGKVLTAAPLNETEFFIRYLASEADLQVNRMASINEKPDPNSVNLLFCEDSFVGADAFLADLIAGGNRIHGCVTWAPKTTEVVEAIEGKERQITDNRNLLIISDILMFNKGFAAEHPEMVKGVVHGLVWGNDQVRTNPAKYHPFIAEVFKDYEWTVEDAKSELEKVHLSNLPENLAFFSGQIDAAGSFEGIYQSSTIAYGSKIVKNPAPASYFLDLKPLEELQASGEFVGQKMSIEPIRSSARSPIEQDPLLSRNIRFLFEPNITKLDMQQTINDEYLATVKKMLQVSPGSMVLLRGHVDDSNVPAFRAKGGESMVKTMALQAMQMSKERAEEVKRLLIEKQQIAAERIELIGRGWEEPLGKDADQNRRVEVQWFTVE
ncbi:MAG: OmpA family protein [Verrucomicrobiales bacterium]